MWNLLALSIVYFRWIWLAMIYVSSHNSQHFTARSTYFISCVQPRFIFDESFLTFGWLYLKTMLRWLIKVTARDEVSVRIALIILNIAGLTVAVLMKPLPLARDKYQFVTVILHPTQEYVAYSHTGRIIPAIWFRYDLSPITVKYTERRQPFYRFVTTVSDLFIYLLDNWCFVLQMPWKRANKKNVSNVTTKQAVVSLHSQQVIRRRHFCLSSSIQSFSSRLASTDSSENI